MKKLIILFLILISYIYVYAKPIDDTFITNIAEYTIEMFKEAISDEVVGQAIYMGPADPRFIDIGLFKQTSGHQATPEMIVHENNDRFIPSHSPGNRLSIFAGISLSILVSNTIMA